MRCAHGDGVTVKVGGVPVDPCIYRAIETHYNCKVHILKCVRCGHIEIEWERQENTEDITE